MKGDAELLEAWQAGDSAAGNELLTRHFPALLRFFHNKVGDASSDLIQRTLTACAANVGNLREASGFRAYLFSAARNQLVDYFRRKSRDRVDFDAGVTSAWQVVPSPSERMAAHEEQKLLLNALRRIPLELQIALELHYWEELSSPELAEVLGIPQGTVKSRIRRAKEALRKQMESLAESGERLASTVTRLDAWAASLKTDDHDAPT